MELIIIIGIAIVALVVWLNRAKSNDSSLPNMEVGKKKYNDDYEIWLNIFKKEKSNIKEFELFGTKAAIAWNDGDAEVVIICITSFRNQEPVTKKWDNFEFNVREKYWTGITPKGSPARIREELKSIGLI
ncbi:MAG: hypothetical protein J7M30_03585 [Deltaproteobacteria bacterium]|nr:hypothetical protein [Deltaproteobacteria bacterium]